MQQTPLTGRLTAYHWLLFAICFVATMSGGTVSTLMSVYLPVAVRDLLGTVDEAQYNLVSAYINAVFILGWTIGGVTLGILGDHIGRSRTIFISIACIGVFTLLTGYAYSWPIVILCRMASGFGVGGLLVTSPTLLSEVWPEKTKSIFIGILSIGFPVGIFSAGAIDLMVSSWHQAFLVGLIPLTLSVLSLWIIRESEYWKSGSGTHKASAKVSSAFSKIHQRDLLVGSLTFGTMLIGLWAIFLWLPTWIQTLLTDSTGQTERGLSMMLLGAGGLTGGFFSGWLSNFLGYKKSMILCFGGCFVMSLLLFGLTHIFTGMIYAEIGCLALFFGASQGILSSYIPQLFPFSLRATATGFCFNLGRFVTAIIVFFVGALVSAAGGYGNALFFFSILFPVGLIGVFLSKEVEIRPVVHSKQIINSQ